MTAVIIYGYLNDKGKFELTKNENSDSYLNLFEEENENQNSKNYFEKYLISSFQLNNLRNVYTNELSSMFYFFRNYFADYK